MNVPIERTCWSPTSQRSSGGHYDAKATHYEAISYRCRACSMGCVFSAQEQKVAYEVTKKFVWWLPSLCQACQKDLSSMQSRDRVLQAQWNALRETLALDPRFLEEWLAVIRALGRLGKPNESMERMLLRRLREQPGYPETDSAA